MSHFLIWHREKYLNFSYSLYAPGFHFVVAYVPIMSQKEMRPSTVHQLEVHLFFPITNRSLISVQFSLSAVSDSLWPHGLQHARLLCPSPMLPEHSQTHVHRAGDAIQPSHPLSLSQRSLNNESHSVVSNSLWPPGLYSPWNSPCQNTGVGIRSLLQGNLPNPGLPHCRQILYQLSYKESPRPRKILEEVCLSVKSLHFPREVQLPYSPSAKHRSNCAPNRNVLAFSILPISQGVCMMFQGHAHSPQEYGSTSGGVP